ncbi:threonine aldolase family protein [Vibrio methylphosphonaticus]|uniref:threonine aldolase family protein n=1 Tax=Vibrio methylphosphonaticus TaxID=2946866 RepID=UPI00202A99DD|nr:beta-eliminating lyase-related protein [Vibrio methylphosphonaticus]MCL9775993.1 beta-eliminating lyase-related protein [Vibrio methylphosphonaticus]
MQGKCRVVLPGNREPSPAQMFTEMATWCEQHGVEHDRYGEGTHIQAFEQKIATLLGFEAGLFVITGTMAQPTALQIACEERQCHNVAMHSSSHIYLHENQGYQLQHRFNLLPVGKPYQPWTVSAIASIPDRLAAVLYELPMREIGGQLPTFNELEEIKRYCQSQGIHLHMDGARLWESAAFYQKPYNEIAMGFNSVYVSLYKGIGGLGGAMLVGDKDFIGKARVWMHRQGGSVYHRTPYIVTAAMQFEQKLSVLPKLFERTQQIYAMLEQYPSLTPNPSQPQANMLHIHLPLSQQQACKLRDKLATEYSVWIGNPQQGMLPQQSYIEWYVGDRLLEMSDDELHRCLALIERGCAEDSSN